MNYDSLPGPVARHRAIFALVVALCVFFFFDWSSPHGAANGQNSPSSSVVDLSPFSHSEELPQH